MKNQVKSNAAGSNGRITFTGNKIVVTFISRCLFPVNVLLNIQQQKYATKCKASLTLTPSDCACRPGALRPCVLTPGVFAGCGLGAGVVRTCVFPEFCKLLDERTLPMLATLPLRSPPPHTSIHTSVLCSRHSTKNSSHVGPWEHVTWQRFAQHPDIFAGAALLSQSWRALWTRLCSPRTCRTHARAPHTQACQFPPLAVYLVINSYYLLSLYTSIHTHRSYI